MTEQAIAARLTAIAARVERLIAQHDISIVDAENFRFLSAHVETLTQQVADLTATLKEQAFEQTFADLRRAEQQRDAAHAALVGVLDAIDIASPGAYADSIIKIERAKLIADAALAASAPQKEEPHAIGCHCDTCDPPAPAQETERGR